MGGEREGGGRRAWGEEGGGTNSENFAVLSGTADKLSTLRSSEEF